ncbi:MAG: hypothetical protein JNJ73_17570 [Hyphomonadaceae bacterium]|nr:hypothetical protein [Hyphomonadaceae bacterium]
MRLMPAFVLALTLGLAAVAEAAPAPTTRSDCFASSNWRGWSAADGGDALYLRVGRNDIYRVELTRGSHVRKSPGDFLISEVRGANWICSAIDLDLTLADDLGFYRPLITRSLRKLSAAEVAAIPHEDLP